MQANPFDVNQTKILKEAVKMHMSLASESRGDQPLQEMIQSSCIKLIDNLDTITEHQSELFQSVRNGGKSYNDFGRFQSCKEDDRLKYFLITCDSEQCNNKYPTDISLGICMPKECDKSDLENLLPMIIKIMKSTNFFSLDNQNKEIDIIPQQLEVVDSVQQNAEA